MQANLITGMVSDCLDPSTIAGAALYAMIFAVLGWLIGRLVNAGIRKTLDYEHRVSVDRTTVKFLGQLAQFAIYLIAFISFAKLIPPLANLGNTWLTSVSVISVVVGVAAQNTLGNLISGIAVVLYRPFKVGDRLHINTPAGPEVGTVESVNLGYTELKTEDNRTIVVPNSSMMKETMLSHRDEQPRAVCVVPFVIGYDQNIDTARAALTNCAKAIPKVVEFSGCPVTDVTPNGVTLTIQAWCATPRDVGAARNELFEHGKKALDATGIRPGVAWPGWDTKPTKAR